MKLKTQNSRLKSCFISAFCLMIPAFAMAQVDETFVFTDANGNVIPDGMTITVHNYEDDPFGDGLQFKSGLHVKNTSAANAYASIKVEITSKDNGNVQICFPQDCLSSSIFGTYVETKSGGVKSGEIKSLLSEWFPEDKGTCTVVYQVRLMKLVKPVPQTFDVAAEGATVTVKYVYDDASQEITEGINGILLDGNGMSNTLYNLNGQKVDGNYKGVVVKAGKKLFVK